MEDLLKKVSEYELLNFLLAGAILVTALAKTTSINLVSSDAVANLLTYYFVGLVVSRIGSLVVEPALKKSKVVKFAPYSSYLQAALKDPKMDVLSQWNNVYRTLTATFLAYVAVYVAWKNMPHALQGKSAWVVSAAAIALMTLFIFAFRKQTGYITQRIKRSEGQ